MKVFFEFFKRHVLFFVIICLGIVYSLAFGFQTFFMKFDVSTLFVFVVFLLMTSLVIYGFIFDFKEFKENYKKSNKNY